MSAPPAATPRANMGTAVSKRKTLRNEAMSSVAAKVRWVPGTRRAVSRGAPRCRDPARPQPPGGQCRAGGSPETLGPSPGTGAGTTRVCPQGRPGAGEWQLPAGLSRWLPRSPGAAARSLWPCHPCTPRTLRLRRGDLSPQASPPPAWPQHLQGFIC